LSRGRFKTLESGKAEGGKAKGEEHKDEGIRWQADGGKRMAVAEDRAFIGWMDSGSLHSRFPAFAPSRVIMGI
jgi:hypothetical protein